MTSHLHTFQLIPVLRAILYLAFVMYIMLPILPAPLIAHTLHNPTLTKHPIFSLSSKRNPRPIPATCKLSKLMSIISVFLCGKNFCNQD